MSTKRALKWCAFWVGISLLFDLGVYIFLGQQKALEFLGGYVMEESLSIDNLFLFVLVFSSFGIKPQYQRRVLNYGIIGAMILRLLFVVLGVAIINLFHWMLYVFGALLIFSGIKMMVEKDQEFSFSDSKIYKTFQKFIPVTDQLHGGNFFVKENGKLFATPLLAILVIIEFTDIIFAVDSIPAIFSITTDLFIVYSSNILAILGLRSMYFLLGNLQEKFWLVKYGVGLVLLYTGAKLSLLMIHFEIPLWVSLIVIFSVVGASILASRLFPNPAASEKKEENAAELEPVSLLTSTDGEDA